MCVCICGETRKRARVTTREGEGTRKRTSAHTPSESLCPPHNVSNKKKDKSRLSEAYCTKSKKELSGDLFVSSCLACLTATDPCHD